MERDRQSAERRFKTQMEQWITRCDSGKEEEEEGWSVAAEEVHHLYRAEAHRTRSPTHSGGDFEGGKDVALKLKHMSVALSVLEELRKHEDDQGLMRSPDAYEHGWHED